MRRIATILLSSALLLALVLSRADASHKIAVTIAQLPIGTSGATVPLLNGTNTWSALQTFGAGVTTSANTTSIFGISSIGAPGTAAGEKIGLYNGAVATSDYSLGVNASELWLNAGAGVVDFYTAGVKTGGVGTGGFIYPKLSAAPTSAPGAGLATVFAVAGTNSGTCKLQAMAGTSTTPVTIVDNIGSGC